MSIISIIFYALIILMVVSSIKEIPRRIQDLKQGKKAILYLILTLPVLLITFLGATILSEYIPILKWGWLGYNIVFGPSLDTSAGTTMSSTIVTLLIFISVIVICLIFNYHEEKDFRKKWIYVPIWAGLHLIMGIPIYAVIPIFSVGIIYKYVYDRHSLEHAYTIHFATNMAIILLAISLLIYGVS